MVQFRFPLSLKNVEDLPTERGIDLDNEAVRLWWNRFGLTLIVCSEWNALNSCRSGQSNIADNPLDFPHTASIGHCMNRSRISPLPAPTEPSAGL